MPTPPVAESATSPTPASSPAVPEASASPSPEEAPAAVPEASASPSPQAVEAEAPPRSLLPETGRKILLMHYMPWYGTPTGPAGEWSPHWKGHQSQHHPDTNGADGQPDIYSHYHPLIGLYDSADPDLLECHLLQMKLAGIDGVVADWYGIAPTADFPKIHAATRALDDATGRFGMKFAVCFEDRTIDLMVQWKKLQPDQIPDHMKETFRWMDTNWFSQPQYLRLGGRPAVLNFGPMYVKDPAVWSAAAAAATNHPALFGLHHLWKNAGMDGGMTWVHWEPWKEGQQGDAAEERLNGIFTEISGGQPGQIIVSACPGFNDVYAQHHPVLDHRDGATLRESLEVCMKGPWPVIQLVTWNDYGEGTMIEPTHEFGYRFLEIIQEARRKELGDSFRFTPEDLKLPARLYALRKKGGVPSAELDRISRMLADGDCTGAAAALKKLDAP